MRKKVDDRLNETDGKRGGREQNFDLIHYRDIIVANWDLFKDIYGRAEAGGGKDKQTAWIVEIGDMRNIVSHPTRQQFLSPDNLETLKKYAEWVKSRWQYAATGIDGSVGEKDGEAEVS